MRIIESPHEMQASALQMHRDGQTIALVPTMGFLHDGHASLIRLARSHADRLVVSIFVNPTQFGVGEDLATYPRDFERDRLLCEKEGVDTVFHPTAEDTYGRDHSVYVEETVLSRGMCGKARPSHFRGVTTVVTKLFNIAQPDVAVFGQKDAQQVRVVQRMVRDLNFPVTIIVGPTVREPDGLAMSSRNKRLSSDERAQALCLVRSLELAARLHQEGTRSSAEIREAMCRLIAKEPSAEVDYIEIVDHASLQPVETIDTQTLIAIAVTIGETRLIDNRVISSDDAAQSL